MPLLRKAGLMAIAFFAFTFAGSLTARADLIQLTNVQLSGQGIGATLTVLTLQNGSPTTESAYVSYVGGTQQTVGDFSPPPGSPKNQTFTFGQLGITNANQLALVVNLAEANNEVPAQVTTVADTGLAGDSAANYANSITLNVFSSTGTLLQQHSLAVGTVLTQDQSGVGGSGLVFGLTAPQAAALQALFAAQPNIVLTVGASFTGASGGNDTIQAVRIQPVPEPMTMLLFGTGLAGVAAKVRRRRKAAKA